MSKTDINEKSAIIAQEIKFARALAGNDPTLRRRVLKNLKTWLTTRSQSTFGKATGTRGLFYCMWMSDKPLVQEELAESLGSLVRCFDHDVPVALQFYKAFLITMGNEWFGIDRWRMDKFMMLVRRVTRQALFALHESNWQKEHVALFNQTIDETIMNRDVASFGLMNHFNDLFLNELAKVTDGNISKETVKQIMEVFVQAILKTDDGTVSASIKKNIFHALMQQSDLGQEFEEKFEMWKSANFVTGNIDNVEFMVDDGGEEGETADGEDLRENGQQNEGTEEEEEAQPEQEETEDKNEAGGEGTEKVFDPRAGRVNVDIPQIEFDPQDIIELVETYRYKSYVNSKGKKRAIQLVKQFTKFADGVYPIGVKRVPSINPKDYAVDIDEQVEELENYRSKLVGEKRKSLRELKKERKMKQKLERLQREAQQEPKGTEGENGAMEVDDADAGPASDSKAESDSTNDASEQNKTKRKRRNKVAPEKARKQAKLELLERKRAEKMNALKERLKSKKKSSAQIDETDVVPQLVPIEDTSSSIPAPTVAIKEKKAKPIPAEGSTEKAPKKNEEKTPIKKKQQQQGEDEKSTPNSKPFKTVDEWSEPLQEGEEEYFIPSRKMKLLATKQQQDDQPQAKLSKPSLKRQTTPAKGAHVEANEEETLTPTRKRVKIALSKNVAQDLVEHIKQVKRSPQVPFDSSRKPAKSLLKPNLIPSPINPFYKKKIGLQ
ncbi:ribosomal RNA processing protein 1 homolog [Anopheles maculipalpis]|uniref:ribosomal RNA processing protein 1 homolog n=1 Tax=Anopheles maculipalpis TaxID=1496333 RepID=UPI00215936B4|nr:ribosomal RNA processing protein 1 homolog [Anopheles maculipalpis]